MRRGLTLLVSAYLLVWIPLGFAIELFATAGSFGMRGAAAVVELAVHAVIASVCATAGYMLLIRAPAARAVASAAIVGAAVVAVQSVYWTVLPRQLAPGESLPAMAVIVAVACLSLLVLWVPADGPDRS